MFAIPGIGALIIFILARPQEFLPVLQRVPLLYLFCAAAVGGLILDLKLRRLQPVPAPTLPWALGFVLWAIICTSIKAPQVFMRITIELAILLVLYGTIAHTVQRLRSLAALAGVVMTTALFLSIVCFHQGFQPRQCVAVDEAHPGEGVPDGRDCEEAELCYTADSEPGASYRCEKVGWFGTYSIEDRVRYRGELHDPNELAMTICIGGLSMIIAFMLWRRSAGWTAFGVLAVVLIVWTVLLSKSRGGLVVAMAVPGVYLVKRYGPLAIVGAIGAALPVVMLNSRGGEAAEASTMLRYEAWASGLEMFKQSPIFGVGARQFGEHHFMTAHNSYVLALAELGFVGLFLFVTLIYVSVKYLFVGLVQLEHVPGAGTARIWGMALMASMAGLVFQINTLSFAYHSVMWIFLGLAAAWVGVVRHHMPEFRVRIGARDLGLIGAMCAIYAFALLPLWLKLKGAM